MNLSKESAIEAQRQEVEEIFLPVVGYEGLYEVSNLGRIKTLIPCKRWDGKKYLNPQLCKSNGYYKIILWKNKKLKTHYLHKVVILAFLENTKNLPIVNHKNGIKTDNNINNLEWATYSDNINHAYANKLNPAMGETHYLTKLTNEIVNSIRIDYAKGKPRKVLEIEFSLKKRTLADIINNVTWRHLI